MNRLQKRFNDLKKEKPELPMPETENEQLLYAFLNDLLVLNQQMLYSLNKKNETLIMLNNKLNYMSLNIREIRNDIRTVEDFIDSLQENKGFYGNK